MARFKTEVKIFALNQRKQRKKWNEIKESIKEQFGIDPPTVRAMQKWEKRLDQTSLPVELMKDIKGKMPEIERDSRNKFIQSLLPAVLQANVMGEDMEITAWKWFLEFMENEIGRDKVKRVIDAYLKER